MTKLQTIDVRVTTAAPAERVFALLADVSTWTTWGSFDEAVRERPGASDGQGVGERRQFRAGRTRSVEEVVAFEPSRRFSYELRSGLPLDGYHADVDLAPAPDGGTEIHWRSTFRARYPLTGWIYRRALQRFIADLAERLARAAA
jgi:uncharacterized protein YndB with AHSA1/START domain